MNETNAIVEISLNGDKYWYLNGLRHREDGPAVEYPGGDKYWYLNGLRHREDGPAADCNGYKAWYLNGKMCSLDDWLIETNKSPKEVMFYKLKYG